MNDAIRDDDMKELEPLELGQVSEITGAFVGGEEEDDNVVWGNALP